MTTTAIDLIKTLPERVQQALDSVPWATEDDAALRIALSIFEATTTDEALTPPETKLGLRRNWLDKIFTVQSVSWVQSTIATQPLGRYAFCECVDQDGVTFQGTIGGLNVMCQLAAINELNGFPVKVRLVEVKSQSNPDRATLWLNRVAGGDGEEF